MVIRKKMSRRDSNALIATENIPHILWISMKSSISLNQQSLGFGIVETAIQCIWKAPLCLVSLSRLCKIITVTIIIVNIKQLTRLTTEYDFKIVKMAAMIVWSKLCLFLLVSHYHKHLFDHTLQTPLSSWIGLDLPWSF